MVCRLLDDFSRWLVKECCSMCGCRCWFSLWMLVWCICSWIVFGVRCLLLWLMNIVLFFGVVWVCSGS